MNTEFLYLWPQRSPFSGIFPLLILPKAVFLSGRFCRIQWGLKRKVVEKFNGVLKQLLLHAKKFNTELVL